MIDTLLPYVNRALAFTLLLALILTCIAHGSGSFEKDGTSVDLKFTLGKPAEHIDQRLAALVVNEKQLRRDQWAK